MRRYALPGGGKACFVDVCKRDVHAFGCKGERHGAAEAACGASDGGRFPGKLAHRHECHSMKAPPARIKASMKRTCSLAPSRVTSHAASALPGRVAMPITTPVTKACASRRSKRWKSAALQRSS